MTNIIPTQSNILSRFLAWRDARSKRLQRDAWVREMVVLNAYIRRHAEDMVLLAERQAELTALLRGLK